MNTKFEDEKENLIAQIEVQRLKNELFLLKDGTFEHLIYGLLRIFDNPALLLISLILFFVGFYLGRK